MTLTRDVFLGGSRSLADYIQNEVPFDFIFSREGCASKASRTGGSKHGSLHPPNGKSVKTSIRATAWAVTLVLVLL
jgi:hypothetical protein